jgi:hypothetical protein
VPVAPQADLLPELFHRVIKERKHGWSPDFSAAHAQFVTVLVGALFFRIAI